MGKININPYNNSGTIIGYVQQLNSFVNQPVNTNSNVVFNSLELHSDALIRGNLVVEGSTTVLETQNLIVEDNLIVINSTEIGAGVSGIDAGIEIERGTLTNYYFAFNETTNTFRIGEIGNTQAVATREDNPLNNGIMIWDNSNFKLTSVNTIPIDINFTSSNSTNPNNGAIRVLGLGVSGNLNVKEKISLMNTNGSLDIIPGTSSVLFNSSDLLVLNTNNIRIESTKKLYFSNILNYINYDGVDLNIVTSGNLNLQGYIRLGDGTNTIESETGALVINGSLGISGNINIFANTQDYNFIGNNGVLKLKNNVDNLKCKFQLEPYDSLNEVDTEISLKNLSTELIIKYDSVQDRHIISNSSSKGIDINEGQLFLNTNGALSSDTNIPSISEFIGSLILAGGISVYNTTDATDFTNGGSMTLAGGASIRKKLFIGDQLFVNSSNSSTDLNSGAFQVLGGISIGENSYFEKNIKIKDFYFSPSVNFLTLNTPLNSYFKLSPLDPLNKTTGFVIEPTELISSEYSYDNSLDCFKILSNKDIHIKGIDVFKINNSGNLSSTGTFRILNNTSSSTFTEGALIVSGGVGIAENLNIGGQLNIEDNLTVKNITITSTIPDYNLTSFSIPDNRLFLNTSSDLSFNLLGNGNNIISIYESGSLINDNDYSKLNIGYSLGEFIINNTFSGIGNSYPLNIWNLITLNTSGTTVFSNTTPSTSPTNGSVIISGGLSISSTQDAVDSTNGGAFTVAGGFAVGKNGFFGQNLNVNNNFTVFGSIVPKIFSNNSNIQLSADGLQTTFDLSNTNLNLYLPLTIINNSIDSFKTNGGIEINKQSLFKDKLIFSFSTQDYILNTNPIPDSSLNLIANSVLNFNFKNINNNYLDDNSLSIHAGYTSITEYSYLSIKYNSTTQKYEIFNDSPTRNYDLVFKNNNQNNQLILKSDGTTVFSNTTASTSPINGSVIISGGLSISSTQDALDSTNGGAFTVAGGFAVGKNTFIGEKLNVLSSENSVSLNTGSIITTGGISTKHIYYGTNLTQQFRIETEGNNSLFVSQGNIDTKYIFTSLNTFNSNDNIIQINSIYGTNSEFLNIGWKSNLNSYIISSESIGSGINKNIIIKTGNSEIILNSSGTTVFSNTTPSTGPTNGSVVISGGLSISSTQDAIDSTNGGGLTVAGGFAVGKNAFIGGQIQISNKISLIEETVSETNPYSLSKGLELISNDMNNLTYTPSIKFMSNDSSFISKKILAIITGKATENYSSSSSGGMGLEFFTTPNNPGIITNPISRFFISEEGVGYFYNNYASTSSNSGCLVLEGGLGIINTTNSVNSLNGGALSVAGGFAVAKDCFIGGKLNIENTDNGSLNTGSIISAGGASFSKNLYVGGDLEIKTNLGTQNYLFTDRGSVGELNLQGLSSNTDSIFNITTFDQDGTDNVLITVYGLGGTNIVNTENLKIGYNYNGGNQYYSIFSLSSGTGIVRPIVLQTGSNTNQIKLNTDGTVLFGNNIPSTSNTIGSVVLTGGLSISNTTSAINSSSGGAMTVAGGVGIQDKLFVAGIATIENTTNSFGINSGSLIVSGGLSVSKNIFTSGEFCLGTNSNNAFRVGTSGFGSYIFTIDTNNQNILSSCSLNITNTADSINTTSGSITSLGGIGIAKSFYTGGNIVLAGTNKILDMNSNRIYNLPTPILDHEATSKSYVDSVAVGIKILNPARVTTTGSNINLNGISNGSILDGETLFTGDRILVKDQTDPIENGVYIVNTVPPLTRSDDSSVGIPFSNKIIYISEGNLFGGTGFQCSNSPPNDIIGTDPIYFVQFLSNTSPDAGAGLTRNGAVLDVNVDNSSIVIETDILKLGSGSAGTGLSYSNSVLSVNSNLSHVTGLGTIISGTWNASTINVSYGGTGNTSFVSGNILFGNGTNPLNTSNSLFWDNSNSRLGLGTNILNSNRLTLSSGDLSIRTVNTETNGIFFENSTGDSYSASITRVDAGGSNTSHLYFLNSGSTNTVSKTTILSNMPTMILSNLNQCIINSSVIPSNNIKLAVNGNSAITGTLTVSSDITSTSGTTSVVNFTSSGTFTAGISNPSISGITVSNTSNISISNTSLFSNGNYRTLRTVISLGCTTANSLSEFEITLPGRISVFTNNFDVIPSVQGYVQNDFIVIQNIISIGKTSSNGNLRVIFQSPSIVNLKTIIFQIQVTYLSG